MNRSAAQSVTYQLFPWPSHCGGNSFPPPPPPPQKRLGEAVKPVAECPAALIAQFERQPDRPTEDQDGR